MSKTLHVSQAFWIIYCATEPVMEIRFDTYERAIDEAELMARAKPGLRYVVMEAVAAREAADMVCTEFNGGTLDIPF